MTPPAKYVQLDIETLSTRVPNCPVVQIAAVLQTPGEDPFFAPRFVTNVDFDLTHADKSTLSWHLNQSNDVSKGLFDKQRDSEVMQDALKQLESWSNSHGAHALEWWCKGANFDFPILEEAASRTRRDNKVLVNVPWKYWNTRDERTLTALAASSANLSHADFKKTLPARDLITYPSHDALYDCMYQCIVHDYCFNVLVGAVQPAIPATGEAA